MIGRRSVTGRPRRAARVPAPETSVTLCIPDDQLVHFPQGVSFPTWPAENQLPRKGEVIYLTSTSAWAVEIVIHEFLAGGAVRVEVWLAWAGSARHRGSPCANWVH